MTENRGRLTNENIERIIRQIEECGSCSNNLMNGLDEEVKKMIEAVLQEGSKVYLLEFRKESDKFPTVIYAAFEEKEAIRKGIEIARIIRRETNENSFFSVFPVNFKGYSGN